MVGGRVYLFDPSQEVLGHFLHSFAYLWLSRYQKESLGEGDVGFTGSSCV